MAILDNFEGITNTKITSTIHGSDIKIDIISEKAYFSTNEC